MITIETVRSVKYKSDPFFIGRPYYDQYCVKFRYQQRTSGKVMLTLDLGLSEDGPFGDDPITLYDKFLRPSPSYGSKYFSKMYLC